YHHQVGDRSAAACPLPSVYRSRLAAAITYLGNKMKAVILAGGFGTRISEESSVRPKPMVEIGSEPILWHIMKMYSAHGINDFVLCLGYKGHLVKEYFADYY